MKIIYLLKDLGNIPELKVACLTCQALGLVGENVSLVGVFGTKRSRDIAMNFIPSTNVVFTISTLCSFPLIPTYTLKNLVSSRLIRRFLTKSRPNIAISNSYSTLAQELDNKLLNCKYVYEKTNIYTHEKFCLKDKQNIIQEQSVMNKADCTISRFEAINQNTRAYPYNCPSAVIKYVPYCSYVYSLSDKNKLDSRYSHAPMSVGVIYNEKYKELFHKIMHSLKAREDLEIKPIFVRDISGKNQPHIKDIAFVEGLYDQEHILDIDCFILCNTFDTPDLTIIADFKRLGRPLICQSTTSIISVLKEPCWSHCMLKDITSIESIQDRLRTLSNDTYRFMLNEEIRLTTYDSPCLRKCGKLLLEEIMR